LLLPGSRNRDIAGSCPSSVLPKTFPGAQGGRTGATAPERPCRSGRAGRSFARTTCRGAEGAVERQRRREGRSAKGVSSFLSSSYFFRRVRETRGSTGNRRSLQVPPGPWCQGFIPDAGPPSFSNSSLISVSLLVAFYQRLFRSPCFIFPEEVLDYRPLRIFAPQEFIMLVQAR
jgi:hypothetical protein